MVDHVFPEDQGTNSSISDGEGDFADAANFAHLAETPNESDFVLRGMDFTADFANDELDISAGKARVYDPNATTSPSPSGTEDRTEGVVYVVETDARSGLSLTSDTTNHVYLNIKLQGDDSLAFEIEDSAVTKVEPVLKIGEVDTSSNTTTELNRRPTHEVESIDISDSVSTGGGLTIGGDIDSGSSGDYSLLRNGSNFIDLLSDPAIRIRQDLLLNNGVNLSRWSDDSGIQTILDHPVTSNATAGDEQSESVQISGLDILKLYTEANGSGGIQNERAELHGDLIPDTDSQYSVGSSSNSWLDIIADKLSFEDTSSDPSNDGEATLNNGDVKIHSGGSVQNISTVGDGKIFANHQVFTSDGTFTVPDSTYIFVICVGGGGGGGESADGGGTGGGGGGGGMSQSLLAVANLSSSESVTVGSGGSGGASNSSGSDGSDGGNSIFGDGNDVVANGGGGGFGGFNSSQGGSGGSPGTGDVTATGDLGDRGLYIADDNSVGGDGGSSPMGGGGRGNRAGSDAGGGNGAAGNQYGGGGGGASTGGNGTSGGGGDGADGVVIIRW